MENKIGVARLPKMPESRRGWEAAKAITNSFNINKITLPLMCHGSYLFIGEIKSFLNRIGANSSRIMGKIKCFLKEEAAKTIPNSLYNKN